VLGLGVQTEYLLARGRDAVAAQDGPEIVLLSQSTTVP
jgi:hypothetical protein